MNRDTGELVVPPEAAEDTDAGEVLRAWIVKGALHCSLRPTIWPEPGNWGILLADVARHVANAFHTTADRSPMETLEDIRRAFQAELDTPTDSPEGSFYEEQ